VSLSERLRLGLWEGPDCNSSSATSSSITPSSAALFAPAAKPVDVPALLAKWRAKAGGGGGSVLFNTIPFTHFLALLEDTP